MAKKPAATVTSDKRIINRLVLFLDGTWNDDKGSDPATHIVTLRNLVQPVVGVQEQATGKGSLPTHALRQRVYYDTGVGTSWRITDKLFGGIIGEGLETNVRQAYKFISQFYRDPSDEILRTEIVVFGFSRGAFTARSLVGYMGASGLLRREHCTDENEERAWAYYRTPPKSRSPGERAAFDGLLHAKVRVKGLCVFDTVGALGIPSLAMHWGEDFLKGINALSHGFHDAEVSSIMDTGLHALAIDENRAPFGATLWQLPRHRDFKRVEQVWFSGAHSDVGGGYADKALAMHTIRWMLDQTTRHGLVHWSREQEKQLAAPGNHPQHDPRGLFYKLATWRPLMRIINQSVPKDAISQGYVINEFKPYEAPVGEMIHWSALERLGHTVTINRDSGAEKLIYKPMNLVHMLPRIFDTYKTRARHKLETKSFDTLRNATHNRVQDTGNTMLVVKRMAVGGLEQQVELDPANADHCDMVMDLIADIRSRGIM